MQTKELLVGSYRRRSDAAPVRVVRVDGTHTYRAYLRGILTAEGTRSACMKVALS